MLRAKVLALILPLGMVAFNSGCDECVCSMIFVEYTVTIVDDVGDPAVALGHSVQIVRTGQTLPAWSRGGPYSLIDDLERHRISRYGERLRLTATDAETTVTADYVVDVPGVCRCHVKKASGADTLVRH
jgi:hypothetical protein